MGRCDVLLLVVKVTCRDMPKCLTPTKTIELQITASLVLYFRNRKVGFVYVILYATALLYVALAITMTGCKEEVFDSILMEISMLTYPIFVFND